MKFSQAAFQLLALYNLAAASPCKPFSSGTSTVTSTTAIESSITLSVESGSSTDTLSETESASDSTALVLSSSAEPTTTLEETTHSTTLLDGATTTGVLTSSFEPTTTLEATTDSKALVDDTTTTDLLTSSVEPTTTLKATTTILSEEPTTTFVSTTIESTTTTAEASTTTTSVPQGPLNLALNCGFEDEAVNPWVKASPDGTLSITTSNVHSGNQAGYFIGQAPSSVDSDMGIKQHISALNLEAEKAYKLSAWYTLLEIDVCFGLTLSCGAGYDTFYPATQLARGAGFSQAEITCSWTQEQLNDGPFIQVQGSCFGLEIIIDDVVLEEVV
ncbi:hypothetical protein FIE12Z_1219 [Fusarium flagelliforme]|uniref:CBM-cenC domain-containing protein n=1 Tax=Fusarium flagelliforme TaxID=2675880 RepID=A0A395N2V7_9HYPO|nr:hypothetical protein FIE12Z_1219 [Fusarium flagelliforme]